MKKIAIISAGLLVVPCVALAIPVPDTGQTSCYEANGNEILPCPQQGEQFYGQDGNYNINTQSYTKLDENGNVLPDEAVEWTMVRDNATGLIWEVKTDDASIHDKDNSYNWWDAQDVFIAQLNANNFGRFSDWRLPTIKEISFIINRENYDPCMSSYYFPNSAVCWFWSSNTDAYDSTYAWAVELYRGVVKNDDSANNKSHSNCVRAVRGGQSTQNFINHADGTVTDITTGLMWQQDVSTNTDWSGALSYCENLTLADYNDWRLPNVNELQSLIDYSRFGPSINTDYFPNTVIGTFWSSTTVAYPTYSGWHVSFNDGYTHYGYFKSKDYYVRAVRCGDSLDLDCDSISNDEDDCPYDPDNDIDNDSICGDIDNCPNHPNGPLLGTCLYGAVGETCTTSGECGTSGFCGMAQEDAYPPGGNGIGDACECEGDLDRDNDVDADDVTKFLEDFGRSQYNNPCP